MQAFSEEKEKLTRQHAAAMAEAADMSARRTSDTKQFAFVVRGSHGGSVPCQIFEAEPDSVLNRMYNGEWQYAVDDTGHAMVNSNPTHWPLILDWLSFGSLPSQPTREFLAECEYWQLQRLLAALDAREQAADAKKGIFKVKGQHSFKVDSLPVGGFSLKGCFSNFQGRYRAGEVCEVRFSAWGQSWTFSVSCDSCSLNHDGPELLIPSLYLELVVGPSTHSHHVTSFGGLYSDGVEAGWNEPERSYLLSWECLEMDGSLSVLLAMHRLRAANNQIAMPLPDSDDDEDEDDSEDDEDEDDED